MQTINFQSEIEKEFYEWLIEAQATGLIKDIKYEPYTLEIIPKIIYKYKKYHKKKSPTIKDRELLKPMKYTPDFEFKVHYSLMKVLDHSLLTRSGLHYSMGDNEWYDVIVDIKSSSGNKFNNNRSALSFPLKQKALFMIHGIYINKVIPNNIFKISWCPSSIYYKINGKRRETKRTKNLINIDQFKKNK